MTFDFLEGIASALKMKVRDFEEPPELPTGASLPTLAVVREIDIAINGSKIEITYTRAHNDADVSTAAKLSAVLQAAGARNYPFPTNPIPDPEPVWPYSSPLSLNNNRYVYLIYILSAKDWQFARQKAPITIGKKSNSKGAYFSATRIDRNGVPDNGKAVKDDCFAAFVIANAEAASEGAMDYIDRINLHVDIKSEGPSRQPLYMPIIIDPDVRHPGGSGF